MQFIGVWFRVVYKQATGLTNWVSSERNLFPPSYSTVNERPDTNSITQLQMLPAPFMGSSGILEKAQDRHDSPVAMCPLAQREWSCHSLAISPPEIFLQTWASTYLIHDGGVPTYTHPSSCFLPCLPIPKKRSNTSEICQMKRQTLKNHSGSVAVMSFVNWFDKPNKSSIQKKGALRLLTPI